MEIDAVKHRRAALGKLAQHGTLMASDIQNTESFGETEQRVKPQQSLFRRPSNQPNTGLSGANPSVFFLHAAAATCEYESIVTDSADLPPTYRRPTLTDLTLPATG